MTRRVTQESAWILHRRPYRDTSFLLDVLTEQYGRLTVVARGGRQSKSVAALQPLRPLSIDYVQKSELASLGKFESSGPALNLRDMALWAAFYVNELIVRLVLPGVDHGVALFDLYVDSLRRLQIEPVAQVLRGFEYSLLVQLGYGLSEHVESNDAALDGDGLYVWDAQRGLRSASQGTSGAAILALMAQARDERILPTQSLLASMLQAQLGGTPLRTAAVMRELVGLRRAQQTRHGSSEL